MINVQALHIHQVHFCQNLGNKQDADTLKSIMCILE